MVRQILPQAVKARLDAGEAVYLLDVREPEEREYCRIGGDEFIPLGELPRRGGEVAPPAGAPVVVYCHHGVRSLTGAAILQRFGLADVYSMAGGIEAWSRLIDPSVPRY